MPLKNLSSKILRTFTHLQIYIIFAWCIGFVLGLHIIPALLSIERWKLLTGDLICLRLPFLLLTTGLPLWITLLIFHFGLNRYLPLLCLFKGIAFGFSTALLLSAYGRGVWLANLLFLLCATVNACLMLWFWLRHCDGFVRSIRKDTIIVIIIFFCSCCLERFAVTQLLQMIF